MQVRKQQFELDMEQQTGSKLRKEYVKAVAMGSMPPAAPHPTGMASHPRAPGDGEWGVGPRVLLKRGPGNRGRSACGPTHVARLEFLRETGLMLRCAGTAGNPFQTTRGIVSPVAIRRGEGAQRKRCRDPRLRVASPLL